MGFSRPKGTTVQVSRKGREERDTYSLTLRRKMIKCDENQRLFNLLWQKL